MEKRQARDGIGSTLHDLADCETLRNSFFTPMAKPYIIQAYKLLTLVHTLR